MVPTYGERDAQSVEPSYYNSSEGPSTTPVEERRWPFLHNAGEIAGHRLHRQVIMFFG